MWLKYGLTLLVLMTLVACTSRPPVQTVLEDDFITNTEQLNKWQIRGRIAFIDAQHKKSASFHWVNNDKTLSFSLRNPLGITLATLIYDGQIAQIDADGEQYQSMEPSELIHSITGYRVPIELLSYWVKGVHADNDKFQHSFTHYKNGLIKQLFAECQIPSACKNWEINYLQYEKVELDNSQYMLPISIVILNLNDDATIKFKVNRWSSSIDKP